MRYDNMITLKSRLGNYDAGLMLDVAVGNGEFLKFALASFRSYQGAAGIDPDPESLRVALRLFTGTPVILVAGSALAMPFIDESFDTVTLSNSLHHIEDIDALMLEIRRVCKQRGLIVINEMMNETQSEMQESHMLYHHFISEVDTQLGHYHRETFTLKDLQGIIKSSGLPVLDFFVHEEVTGEYLLKEEIEAMSEKLLKKARLLKGTDYYYYYENKAHDIIARMHKTGIHRPRHVTYLLQP
jgi:SAM-dependent methyltransferase